MNSHIPDLVPKQKGMTRVQQLVHTFMSCFKDGNILPGDKLPSVRLCALTYELSPSTIVAAFDVLRDEGVIESQRGSGFFLARHFSSFELSEKHHENTLSKNSNIELPIDDAWLLANVFRVGNNEPTEFHSFGGGWLPENWYAQDEITKALRDTSRNYQSINYGYGDPYGNIELRRFMVNYLSERSLSVSIDNILLTSGASRALDLISTAFLKAGDTVLVDDPGYCNFLSSMLGKHIKLIGVPWTPEGPDTNKMEEILKKENIKFYFTNPWLQNPTGASITLNVAHKLLNLAERYHLTVVEDNASGELLHPGSISLAAFAGLTRVIQVGSFSKSISPALRVGYIVSEPETLNILMQHKMMTGLTSSFFSEQIVLNVLSQPAYKRHINLLRSKLSKAQQEFSYFLSDQGWEVFCTPDNGYFIYGRPIGGETDSRELAKEAKKEGLLFAPGYLFHPDHVSSTWTRFNVAFCVEKKDILYPFIQKINVKF